MRFHLTGEQEQLYESTRRLALDYQQKGGLRRTFEAGSFDPVFWRSLSDLGLTGLLVPAAHGGIGLGMIDAAIASDALGYGGGPSPLLQHLLCGLAIEWAGSEEQKTHWLPKIAAGEIMATVALAEAGSSWSPDRWTLAPDGGKISGTKFNVVAATDADLFLVGLESGRLGLVERSANGMETRPVEATDRTRPISDVHFSHVPVDLLPGTDGHTADQVLDAALVLTASDAFGGSTRLLDMLADYVRTRRQFGRQIGSFQAVKHQIANMAALIEPMRALHWYAAHAFDTMPQERQRIIALTKAHLTETFMQVARNVVEGHGGIGYTWEYDAQIWFKRAMFDYAMFGVPAIHRARAARLAQW
jgi:alkylation response protein AidB-like acyl-CoA dehydrogenase